MSARSIPALATATSSGTFLAWALRSFGEFPGWWFLALAVCRVKYSQRFSKHLRCPIVRKDKLDILGSRHVFIPANSSQQGDGQPAEDAAGAGELESVFSCSMLPVEYYMEMVHSLSCIGIVDASPAQGPQTVLLKSLVFLTSSENLAGELLKAAMSSRTPCLAICGTDGHCKKLEIMLTEYIYEEQQRDGSTYYIPEMTVKSQNDEPKPKSKAKAKPVTKTRRRRRA